MLVLGANGKTGRLVVERALAKGHLVTVLVRDGNKVESRANVRVLAGDATNLEDVMQAVEGNDAVIDTIGGSTPCKDTTLERTAAHNVVEAMKAKGPKRLIVISMMGLGTSREQAPFWYEHLLMPTFLRGSTKEPLAKFSGIVAILDRQQHFEPPMVLCNTKQLGQSHCDHVRGEDSGIPTRRDQAVTGSFGALAFLGDESHLSDESQDLIGGECDDAEHEMAHYLGVAADSYHPAPELVFQARVHPFHGRTLPIAHLFGGAVAQQSAPFLLLLQLRLPRPIAPRIGIDDRHMPQTAAVLVDGLGIVGRIHQIVEIGDAPGA